MIQNIKTFSLPAAVLALLLFSGCGTSSKIGSATVLDYRFDTVHKSYGLDLTDRMTGGTDMLVRGTKISVMYNYCGANELVVLDHDAQTFTRLPLYNPTCQKIYTEQSDNGTYVLTRNGDLFFYPNGITAAKSLGNIKADSVLFNLGLDIEQYKPGSEMHVNVPENTIYFRIMRGFETETGKYSNQDSAFPIFCKYDILTKKMQLFGSQPAYVEHSLYGLNSLLYDLYKGDSIITSESINGNISVINTFNNRVKVYKAKSKFDTIPIKQFVINESMENAKTLKLQHSVISPLYEPLYYNPFNHYYYRVFHPAMNEYKSDGLLNTSYDKKCVLMILDEHFRLIDEKILPVNEMYAFQIFPLKNGVEIYLPDLFDFNKNRATYSFLRITHTSPK